MKILRRDVSIIAGVSTSFVRAADMLYGSLADDERARLLETSFRLYTVSIGAERKRARSTE